MSIGAKIIGLMQSVFRIFPLGGTSGGIVVRQAGGTPGTDDLQIYHDGTHVYLVSLSGAIKLNAANGPVVSVGGSFDAAAFRLASNGYVAFSNDTDPGSGDYGGGIARVASGVIKPVNTYSGNGWMQQAAGRARVSADVTNTTDTLATATGLSWTLKAGRKYTGRIVLKVNNTVASEGIKLDFNGGDATMTNFWAAASATAGGTTVLGTAISTSLAGVINYTTITGETVIALDVSLVANAAGTLILRFAENASTTGTVTVELGSFGWFEDMP